MIIQGPKPRYTRTVVILMVVLTLTIVAVAVFSSKNPLANQRLYIPRDTGAARHANDLGLTPAQSRALQQLAEKPTAVWFADGAPQEAELRARKLATESALRAEVPVSVIYNIPHRDCGQQSAGGVDGDVYREYIRAIVRGFQASDDRTTVFILEPDAIAQSIDNNGCLSLAQIEERAQLLTEAILTIKETLPRALVYVDAAHPGWYPDPSVLVEPLLAAGIRHADGFAVNVSNFQETDDSVIYGQKLSQLVGGRKHFVVDTSRNGAGPYRGSGNDASDPAWCNPPGIRPGPVPTTETGYRRADAFLYIKRLGESDGACRPGEPPAGEWMMQYALQALGVA